MSTVYTIGYEGTEIDRFIATIKAVGVTMLADVRAVAISRKKGFSKTALRDRLAAEGITYAHLVELGDPKPGRDAARAGRHAEFRRIYSAHLNTAEAAGALKALSDIVRADSVCLMCFERDPAQCHRTIVANRLSARGIIVFNLYGDDPSRYVRYTDTIPRRRHHQGDAEPQPKIW